MSWKTVTQQDFRSAQCTEQRTPILHLLAEACAASQDPEVSPSGSMLTPHIRSCYSVLPFVFTGSVKQFVWLNCVDPACKASAHGTRCNKGTQ